MKRNGSHNGNEKINQMLDWQCNSDLFTLPLVDESEHRGGMRHLAAATSIITTVNNGERVGLTATAVCSVTAEPPRLVVFINKGTYAVNHIVATGLLCVNTLAASQTELACIFAGMRKEIPGPDRFQHGEWGTLVTGAPVLANAKVSFDCRVIKVFDESTHFAFLCEVLAVNANEKESALLYMGGKFYTLKEIS